MLEIYFGWSCFHIVHLPNRVCRWEFPESCYFQKLSSPYSSCFILVGNPCPRDFQSHTSGMLQRCCFRQGHPIYHPYVGRSQPKWRSVEQLEGVEESAGSFSNLGFVNAHYVIANAIVTKTPGCAFVWFSWRILLKSSQFMVLESIFSRIWVRSLMFFQIPSPKI